VSKDSIQLCLFNSYSDYIKCLVVLTQFSVKPSHWVIYLNYIFNPMFEFVHIWPKSEWPLQSSIKNLTKIKTTQFRYVDSHLFRSWMNHCFEWNSWVNKSITRSRLIRSLVGTYWSNSATKESVRLLSGVGLCINILRNNWLYNWLWDTEGTITLDVPSIVLELEDLEYSSWVLYGILELAGLWSDCHCQLFSVNIFCYLA